MLLFAEKSFGFWKVEERDNFNGDGKEDMAEHYTFSKFVYDKGIRQKGRTAHKKSPYPLQLQAFRWQVQ